MKFSNLLPDVYLKSIDDIDFEAYKAKGIKAIITDVDNTIVPHGAPADEHAIEYFKKLKELGIDICILSNNDEPRVKPFADLVGSKYIFKGGKPAARGYKAAMELMGSDEKSTLFIGDQIFTDIWGANRLNIPNIMVEKINPKEEIQIVLKRIPEKFIMWRYKKKNGK